MNALLLIKSFKGKLSLEEIWKKIMNKEHFNIHAFPGSMKEALETYELYGKNIDEITQFVIMMKIQWVVEDMCRTRCNDYVTMSY